MVKHGIRFSCLFCCLCIALISGPLAAADITPLISLTGSEEPVYLGDSVIIELESVGIDAPLDTSALLHEAELLRETIGTRIIVVDDQVAEMKIRRMELLPRQPGHITLGPVSGNSARGPVISNSLALNVLPPTESDWQPENDELQINVTVSMGDGPSRVILPRNGNGNGNDTDTDTDTDTNTNTDSTHGNNSQPDAHPFVGQHIIADIELRHRYPIVDEQVSLPDFDGFDVLEQFVERRTIESRDDEPSWRVTAWRYHLFARRSGQIRVKPVSWKGTMIRSRTQRFDFDKHTPALSLQIQPAADSSRWWLPASQLSLSDSWSRDPRELSAGDEILRTITLSARDVLSNHLPDILPPESRALTSTPIRQTRSQQLMGEHIMATAVFEYRMTALSPIPVFLDTVRVPWYNTVTASAREAIIPARRINVGLPERADLLASLALKGSWLDRIQLQLQGSSITRSLPWHATLGVMLVLATWIWIREFRHWRLERDRRKQGLKSTVLPEL